MSGGGIQAELSHGPAISLRRRLLFAGAAGLLSLMMALAAFLVVDVGVHRRYERGVLVNVWGYRGPVAGRKRPGEYRVAVLGGSSAFGYGVKWVDSMPAILEQKLGRPPGAFRVVNLAYNNEGAHSFTFTLKDYAYLDYDLVCLYEGYNDLGGDDSPNPSVFRHDSPVFVLTGYLPIFPLVFREKASVMVYGDTRDVYPTLDKQRQKRCGRRQRWANRWNVSSGGRVSMLKPPVPFRQLETVRFRGRDTANRYAKPPRGRSAGINRYWLRRSLTRSAPNWAPATVISSARWRPCWPGSSPAILASDMSTSGTASISPIQLCRTIART